MGVNFNLGRNSGLVAQDILSILTVDELTKGLTSDFTLCLAGIDL